MFQGPTRFIEEIITQIISERAPQCAQPSEKKIGGGDACRHLDQVIRSPELSLVASPFSSSG